MLEDFGGNSLDAVIRSNNIDPIQFLKIAIQISHTLIEIHRRKITHKDIKPSNIIYNQQNGIVKITDFGISSFLDFENRVLENTDHLEGSLPYISPEQTGRMNRFVDYRTDFYSLGITFYELLTGVKPFRSNDAAELIHSHIAVLPRPPHEILKTIEPAISAIIMKLMAKKVEDRYQSAQGIKNDLEFCFKALKEKIPIKDFIPGQRDVSERFTISQKLFGREKEISQLFKSFEQICEGQMELMTVRGLPGIGKSILVGIAPAGYRKKRFFYFRKI